MIDHLRGRLVGGGKDFVVVECAGIGFRAHVSAATRKELPPEGEGFLLRTHLHIREGGADLYGFSTDTEREIFLATIGVSGVGPKSALAVLSVLGVPGVLAACAREDAVAFTRVPGIGKKLAQRIALELPDRLKKVSVDFAPALEEPTYVPTAPEAQASEALANLGFTRTEAQLAVAATRREKGADLPADLLIRESLRRLSGGR
ncbi:MAG TPA: Holliday junction branch migration protein RuvA [Candidatus Deferrimicrobiaceae bacterium]|nr:Holliday junction branch migration protein RuvA [Candidatus Deferrimicrobiaceae bacterium]